MSYTRRLAHVLLLSVIAAALMGCAFFAWLAPAASDTETHSATATPVPTPEYMACSWQWATQDLPDLSVEVSAVLNEAGFPVVEAGASAYGENCVRQDGTVDHFAAMQTEFDLTLAVASLDDRETLGNLVDDVVNALVVSFPVKETPGPNQGQIRLHFAAGDQARTLFIDSADDWQALTRGDLRGAALLDALCF